MPNFNCENCFKKFSSHTWPRSNLRVLLCNLIQQPGQSCHPWWSYPPSRCLEASAHYQCWLDWSGWKLRSHMSVIGTLHKMYIFNLPINSQMHAFKYKCIFIVYYCIHWLYTEQYKMHGAWLYCTVSLLMFTVLSHWWTLGKLSFHTNISLHSTSPYESLAPSLPRPQSWQTGVV